MRAGDIYLHADIHGAATHIVKNHTKDPVPPLTLAQAGLACVCRSAAWDAKMVTVRLDPFLSLSFFFLLLYIFIYIYVYVYVNEYMYVCICIYIYMYIYIYNIYIYIHTYIHILIHKYV